MNMLDSENVLLDLEHLIVQQHLKTSAGKLKWVFRQDSGPKPTWSCCNAVD